MFYAHWKNGSASTAYSISVQVRWTLFFVINIWCHRRLHSTLHAKYLLAKCTLIGDYQITRTINCIMNNEQSIIKSPFFSIILWCNLRGPVTIVTSFSWPCKNSCPHHVYHSAMQLQPATDRAWQVPLGYFFAEYHTDLNKLYRNMILAEIDKQGYHVPLLSMSEITYGMCWNAKYDYSS